MAPAAPARGQAIRRRDGEARLHLGALPRAGAHERVAAAVGRRSRSGKPAALCEPAGARGGGLAGSPRSRAARARCWRLDAAPVLGSVRRWRTPRDVAIYLDAGRTRSPAGASSARRRAGPGAALRTSRRRGAAAAPAPRRGRRARGRWWSRTDSAPSCGRAGAARRLPRLRPRLRPAVWSSTTPRRSASSAGRPGGWRALRERGRRIAALARRRRHRTSS